MTSKYKDQKESEEENMKQQRFSKRKVKEVRESKYEDKEESEEGVVTKNE